MSTQSSDVEVLKTFKYERILTQDPLTNSVTLLGTFQHSLDPSDANNQAVVRIEKTALDSDFGVNLSEKVFSKLELTERNDIYSWLFGWLAPSPTKPDVKINVIAPATDAHVRKYMQQTLSIVHETPALYKSVVQPYIVSFPPSRTQWVEDILSGHAESHKVLHSSPSFLILPDMKWDLTTISSLYLVAIVQDRSIRSLRDLRKEHLTLLRSIRREAKRVVRERWGVEGGGVRLFVHYQPSYYHFHVHIVSTSYYGLLGTTIGQAHLLDDIISLLEVDQESGDVGIFQRVTLTYGLGDQHGLYEPMKAAQAELVEDDDREDRA